MDDVLIADLSDSIFTIRTGSVVEPEMNLPTVFALEQNYPNPFNAVTTFRYALPTTSDVNLTIVNSVGKTVAVYTVDRQSAGYHIFRISSENLPSGIYICRFSAQSITTDKSFHSVRKMALIK